MTFFTLCRKCRKVIDSDDGYWVWEKRAPLKDGYYHPKCGHMNNPAPKKGLDPLNKS